MPGVMGSAFVAHPDGGYRRHIAAGAVAPHCDARRVCTELDGVQRYPSRRVQAIFQSGRKFVLGRQPVIDRGNNTPGAGTQIAGHSVMRI